MDNRTSMYEVAGHRFEVQLKDYLFLKERMADNYAPFKVINTDERGLFVTSVVAEVRTDDIEKLVFAEKRTSEESGRLRAFTTDEGWLFELTQPHSGTPNARIRIDKRFRKAELALRGSEQQCLFGLNSGMMLCYLLATAPLGTLLTHSSCVVHSGKAYLFLGKSGTGKSTHSRLWLENIADTVLLNDDHPVLRINGQGEIIVYGSPWSGKTPCYRNESAHVGGIVRICRAKKNRIHLYNKVEAYASLTTSISGMTWDETLADYRHLTIEQLVENVPCYVLYCLPDDAAANLCHRALTDKGNMGSALHEMEISPCNG